MKTKNEKRFIVWAVDPSQDPATAKNLIIEMQHWAKKLNAGILPVSVFSKASLNLPFEVSFPWKEGFENRARKTMADYLKRTKCSGLFKPELIFSNALSRRPMAAELGRFAESKKALMIFAQTRAHKTLNPFRLGGFAETLAASSRVPVLLLNRQSVPSGKNPNFVFATDLRKPSRYAFDRLVPWAKSLGAEVKIFNQLEAPSIDPAYFGGPWETEGTSLESIMKSIEKARSKKAHAWAGELDDFGVNGNWTIQRQSSGLAGDILKFAKKQNSSLIALASQSGSVSQTILGSVARDIILQAHCPVLVFYRPKPLERLSTSKQSFSRKTRTPMASQSNIAPLH